MVNADFIDPSEETVYLFVDYANAYREAVKRHNQDLFSGQGPDNTETTNRQAATTQQLTQPDDLTFEQALATLLKNLKKSVHNNAVIKTIVEDLFNTFTTVTKLENREKIERYRKQLSTMDGRKVFIEDHLPNPRFVLQSNNLEYICTRFNVFKELPKEQYFIFVSHKPGERKSLENNGMFKRMAKKSTLLYHERVPIKKRGEKEKGVDVNIAVHITDIIRKSVDAGKRIRIVLVSGDADYKPVVEYAIRNNVLIDVWGWMNAKTSSYYSFLESRKKLFYLDRYLYQIGFHEGIIYEYEFLIFPTADLTGVERKRVNDVFASISHYAVARRLTEKNVEPGLSTSDFEILWSGQGFTIAFFREESRNRFEKFLRANPNDELVQKINQLQHKKKLFSGRANEAQEQLAVQSLEDKKTIKNWLDVDDDQESDSGQDNADDSSSTEDIDNDSNADDTDGSSSTEDTSNDKK